jgi:hypothetical protein
MDASNEQKPLDLELDDLDWEAEMPTKPYDIEALLKRLAEGEEVRP